MNMRTVPLEQIAPPQTSSVSLDPDAPVWFLTPDQVQSRTGYIVSRKNVRPADASKNMYVFDDANVLYSKFRPDLKKVVCPDEPGIATEQFIPLRPRSDLLDRDYLMYYLRSDYFLSFANTFGARRPEVMKARFLKHRIPLPSLPEQRSIVGMLKRADELNKNRAKADFVAARILPALFYEMFGDPVANRKGWSVKTLGEIAVESPKRGIDASVAEWTKGSPRYVRISDITDDGCLEDGGAVGLDSDNWAPYRLSSGDILFAGTTMVGKTYLYQPRDGLCVYDNSLIRFRLNCDRVSPWYLFALTQTAYYRNWIERHKQGMVPNISPKKYSSFRVPCPPISLQKDFTVKVKRLMDIRKKRSVAGGKTQNLLDVLLYRTFDKGSAETLLEAGNNGAISETVEANSRLGQNGNENQSDAGKRNVSV